MHLHEYQTKLVLNTFGIPYPDFAVASTRDEARKAVDAMRLDSGVVKAQVHAGGRGKAGAVKIGKSRQELVAHAEQILGMKVINEQTGPQGMVAHQVLLSPLVKVKKEYYLGAVIDRQKACAMLVASPEGGMDIEEVAKRHPHQLLAIPIQLDGSVRHYHLIRLAKLMGWSWDLQSPAMKLVTNLAKAFVKTDALLLEINPLVETEDGELLALDAKLTVDDNALYRQPELAKQFDLTQISQYEAKAREYDLAYVAMQGNIGCMVNGAGLAMATMDMIHYVGGSPANFLDVGGGANQEKVAEGFKLILSDPKVKAILVNIFGGIMNCETIAAGIIAAAGDLKIEVPLVVRLEGTNVEQGKKMLRDAKLHIDIAHSMSEAAQLAVAKAK